MKKLSVLAMLLMLVLISVAPVVAQDRIEVVWFVGLGTGTNEQQIEAQEQVVADFNASQDEVELVLVLAGSNETARDTLATLIASGDGPDIVGPVGVGGSNSFNDQWADLTPMVESSGYDLSGFDPALVDLYRDGDALVGIPFAVFPSVTYYNRNLFDEAGANYPPSEFGEMYVMPDGTEVEWNYDTLRELAMYMTVDAEGYDAGMEEFDASNVVQFGLNFQWARIRLMWTDMAPADFYDEEANAVSIPEEWVAASEWLQAAVWEDSFIPNDAYANSELFGSGNSFQSGNIAMSIVPLWYTCCLGDSVGNFEWDFGVVPRSFDGEYHVATDADTFRILKDTENPDAAFTALSYLLDEAVPTLAPVYGAFPARPEYQQAFEESKNEQYGWELNWGAVEESLAYNNPGNMHHESFIPNWATAYDREFAFQTLIFGETGADVDVAAELQTLEDDYNSIISN